MAQQRKGFGKDKERSSPRFNSPRTWRDYADDTGATNNGAGGEKREQPGAERHPATQHHDPKRYVGTVVRVVEDKAFSFIRDGQNVEYFAHKSVYTPPELFEDAARAVGRNAGQPIVVSFFRTETTKGWRAAGVRIATAEEAITVEASDDSRGNR